MRLHATRMHFARAKIKAIYGNTTNAHRAVCVCVIFFIRQLACLRGELREVKLRSLGVFSPFPVRVTSNFVNEKRLLREVNSTGAQIVRGES